MSSVLPRHVVLLKSKTILPQMLAKAWPSIKHRLERPILRSRRGWREGRGFSLGEATACGFPLSDLRKYGIPTDTRRRTSYKGNIIALEETCRIIPIRPSGPTRLHQVKVAYQVKLAGPYGPGQAPPYGAGKAPPHGPNLPRPKEKVEPEN